MRSSILPFDQVDAKTSRKLLPLIGAAVLTVLALAAFAITWAVRESDAAAVARQLRMTENSLRGSLRELTLQQEIGAVWDDPVEHLNSGKHDPAWLDDNIGTWYTRTYGHNNVYLLNPRNEPIYAGVEGTRVDPSAYNDVRLAVEPHVQDVRRAPKTPPITLDVQPSDSPHLTTGRAVYDAHLLKLLGRPAAVSVMRIVPHSEAVPQEDGREYLLVSVRFLDGTFLKEIAHKNLIDQLRFSATSDRAPDEVAIPLTSDMSERIGYFVWKPDTPGTKILSIIGPATALVCLVVLGIIALLLRWLGRMISTLGKTVIELRASEAQAQHLAFHDVLTGLPNRALFNDRLDQALARAQGGETVAVLMIDLDRFKNVNDTLGHHGGDSLIREFAERLSALVSAGDTVARLGGDEFAIVQTDISGEEEVKALCERILASVHQPFDVLGHQSFVGASIGIALAQDAGPDRIEIMRRADIALYHAKDEGRGCYRAFSPVMDESVQVRGTFEDDLRTALATGEGLEVAYQPQVSTDGKPILGLEALVRWRHPTLGMIPPEQFIPIAEHTGLITQLGELVLRDACAASRTWPDVFISVNLSPVQFRAERFADRVIQIVRECGADPTRIELEITEGVFLDESRQPAAALKALRAAGFRIALDDFGIGYSSLGYLREYEVDKIKIDRSFVSSLGQDKSASAIVSAIVALGQAMNLTVTAEGVETPEQHHFLQSAGCDELQGYLFARALPKEQVSSLMSRAPRVPQRPILRPSPSGI